MNLRLFAAAITCCLIASITWAQCIDCPRHGVRLDTLKMFDASAGDHDYTDTEFVTDARPPKPTVEMLEAGVESKSHSSCEQPDHWIPVPYGPLTFRALPPDEFSIDGCEFFLDGQPWLRATPGPDENIEWHCPALGRHLVQVRYRMNDLWSQISDPIRFEVLGPPRPQIVALADGRDVPVPTTDGIFSVRTDALSLKLANVLPGSKVAVYLDGQSLGLTTVHDSCCAQININGHAETGVHSLTVRNVLGEHACGVTSEAAPAIMFHYYVRGREVADVLHRNVNCHGSPAKCAHEEIRSCQLATLPLSSATDGKSPAVSQAIIKAHTDVAKSKIRSQTAVEAQRSKSQAAIEKARAESAAAQAASHAQAVKAEAEASVERAKAAAEAAKAQAAAEAAKARADADAEGARARAYADAVKANAAVGIATPLPPPAAPATHQPPAPALMLKNESPTKKNATQRVGKQTAMEKAEHTDQDRQEFCFFSTAHLPRRDYGLQGEVVGGEGLVIFEGMMFSINENGRYELSFETNTPDVPVTVRLRLLLRLAHDGAWHTVTLPPIRVFARHEQEDAGGDQELQHHVRSGDIAALRGLGSTSGAAKITDIRREGTARFGYERADVQYSQAAR